MTFLKSRATNKYLCYNLSEGSFQMTHLNELNCFCVFTFETKHGNEYKFTIGSVENRLVHLAFNRVGHLRYNNKYLLLTPNKLKSCQNSALFSLVNSNENII